MLSYKSLGELPPNWADFLRNSYGAVSESDQELGILAFALSLARPCASTNKRDKIYAILGVLRYLFPDHGAIIQPDYKASVEHIYTSFTAMMLMKMPHLTLLSYVEDRSRKLLNLPSWVPDYSAEVLHPLIPLRGGNAIGETYNASVCQSPRSAPRSIDAGILTLHGASFNSITAVCPATLADVASQHDIKAALRLCLLLTPRYEYVDNQTRIEALWRTMILDMSLDDNHPAPTSMKHAFCSYAEGLLAICISEALKQGIPEAVEIASIRDLLG